MNREGREWSQKISKIGEANGMPSLPIVNTGHVKGKCGFSARSEDGLSIHIWP